MNTLTPLQTQLLATKFYVPVTSGPLIPRPRLSSLLGTSPTHPLTLVSAPAGFGKTTLLAIWGQSLQANHLRLCWLSLDEEDDDPRLFWMYVLSALDKQQPQHFTPLLAQLQSPQGPPIKSLLTALINLLVESRESFVLILDDYQLIGEELVHTTLSYLVEHLPPQLRIVISTRTDPPLSLSRQRAQHQVLEVRTEQLRCTAEETRVFFKEVTGLQLPDETIQQVATRTEGWLVSLQLLTLSLQGGTNPATLLEEVRGDQHYILDYLTEVVLGRQPQEVQAFLLSTCILERLTAPLCDAVMQQTGSQQMLRQLEQTNLFVVSLDNRRQWYRYHALFAEALRYRLEQTYPDQVLALHHRASLWYAKHDQITQAILHAFQAKEWHWAADLLEQKSLQMAAISWGASQHEMILLREWLKLLPLETMGSHPRFCLNCIHLLWQVTPPAMLNAWLKAIEATLTVSLTEQMQEDNSQPVLDPKVRQQQQDLLGEVIYFRAFFQSFEENGEASLTLCEQVLTLLSADNVSIRADVGLAQGIIYHTSSVNSTEASIESGLQAASLARMAGQNILAMGLMVTAAARMIGAGWLNQTHQLTQQAILLGTKPGEFVPPEVGWPTIFQAEVLREWSQLDAALSLAEEAVSLCEQVKSCVPLTFLLYGHAVLLRVSLSRGELDEAWIVLQQIERMGINMNQSFYTHLHSYFTTGDQIRLWLICGELDRATRWAEELDRAERHITPFAREREEVARVRIFLAKNQPTLALQRLEPVLQRATAGKRWGHLIEMRLLQAMAHQMHQEEKQALDALSKAVRLAEPEGYIRSFLDEGPSMEALLYRLRKQSRKQGPTPYLDTLLTAFQQEGKAHSQTEESTKTHQLPEPLSERELEVLQLLVHGASNQEIAQELVIAIDTVKRHVSHIFSKLGVNNRVQAVRQTRELSLFDEDS